MAAFGGLPGVCDEGAVCGAPSSDGSLPCSEAGTEKWKCRVSGRGSAEYPAVCSFRIPVAAAVDAGGPLVEASFVRIVCFSPD